MQCGDCQATCKKFGKNRNGSQRYRCTECGKTFSDFMEGRIEGLICRKRRSS